MKTKKKYWHRFFISECVLCGKKKIVRIRLYSKKPKDGKDRYIQDESFACSEHFF